jgi:hypothetical protein
VAGGCPGHSQLVQSGLDGCGAAVLLTPLRREFETRVFADTGSVPSRRTPRFIRSDGSSAAFAARTRQGAALVPAGELLRRA